MSQPIRTGVQGLHHSCSPSPQGKVPLIVQTPAPLPSGEIVAQLYRRGVQFKISCFKTVGGRWGQRTSIVYTTAILSFGLREFETIILTARELAHLRELGTRTLSPW